LSDRAQGIKWGKQVEGALHEVAQNFRILTAEEVVELYKRKRSYKKLEAKLGLN
jgi:hypothetical protein